MTICSESFATVVVTRSQTNKQLHTKKCREPKQHLAGCHWCEVKMLQTFGAKIFVVECWVGFEQSTSISFVGH